MRYPLKRCLRTASLLLAGFLLTSPAAAQTAGEGLSPTLANIKKTHVVRLGYRESSPPFSFMDPSNRPIGYSLELCEAIVDEIGIEVDDANLSIEYVKVTSDDRIPAVVAKWEGELAPEHALGPDDVVPPDMIPGELPGMQAGHA